MRALRWGGELGGKFFLGWEKGTEEGRGFEKSKGVELVRERAGVRKGNANA